MLSSDRISACVYEEGFLEKSSTDSQSTTRKRVTELPGKPVFDQNANSHLLPSENGRANGHLPSENGGANGHLSSENGGANGHLPSENGARSNGHLRTDSESIPDIYRRYVPKFPIMWSTRYRTVTCLLAGAVFGLAMEKGRGKVVYHVIHILTTCRELI